MLFTPEKIICFQGMNDIPLLNGSGYQIYKKEIFLY